MGTRPNFMKVAPVMRALGHVAGVRQVLVHTEQHYDRRMSDAFFEDLDMPEPDYFLGVGSGTHTQQTAGVMLALEPVLHAVSPDVVLVAGDVNSTLGAGLAAAQAHVPVAHLEAGLRSRDRTMPEEHNRTLTDHLSDLLLSPTQEATDNLRAEGICAERIAFVGNTMIDSLRAYEQVARELDVATELGLGDFVLVTLHRPGLVTATTGSCRSWRPWNTSPDRGLSSIPSIRAVSDSSTRPGGGPRACGCSGRWGICASYR